VLGSERLDRRRHVLPRNADVRFRAVNRTSRSEHNKLRLTVNLHGHVSPIVVELEFVQVGAMLDLDPDTEARRCIRAEPDLEVDQVAANGHSLGPNPRLLGRHRDPAPVGDEIMRESVYPLQNSGERLSEAVLPRVHGE
jgi:hypothetical protein